MGTAAFELIQMPSFTTPAFELTQMPSFTTMAFGLTQVLFFRAKVHNLSCPKKISWLDCSHSLIFEDNLVGFIVLAFFLPKKSSHLSFRYYLNELELLFYLWKTLGLT